MLIQLVLLSFLLPRWYSFEIKQQNCSILENSEYNMMILGEDVQNIEEYPYHVSIHFTDSIHKPKEDSQRWKTLSLLYISSGSIISSQYILTSAHYIHRIPPSALLVTAGSKAHYSGLATGNFFRYVDSIKLHPESKSTISYDVAILVLSRPLIYSSKINSVKLPALTETLPGPNTKGNVKVGNVTCWKITGKNVSKKAAEILTVHEINMFDQAVCCCDFGSPFVVEGTQYGILSKNKSCEFVSIISVRKFIKDIIGF